MPVITLDIAPLSEDKKAKLVKELTMTAAKYIELPEETFYVFIREYPLNDIGVGGELLSRKNG